MTDTGKHAIDHEAYLTPDLASACFAACLHTGSALASGDEAALYTAAITAHSSLVSVGHRPGLHAYHTHVLVGSGTGAWTFMTVQQYANTATGNSNSNTSSSRLAESVQL